VSAVHARRFDCVFPTRTARFGVALITTGSLRLKGKEHSADLGPVDAQCRCSTCRNYTRAVLHVMFKENNALAAQLLTKHNVSYMMRLMRTMRQVRHSFTRTFSLCITMLRSTTPCNAVKYE
jgi:queuine tRNA-ribosyltransferase